MTTDSWTVEDLRRELERFEQAARAAGLRDNTVRTYVDRTGIFLRWLAGEYEFRGPQP